ncbi:extracellular solute-binding protein family 1 [Beutenbergia cavernae DSM 12333]|uniref:Extracellular solute-binding protein family 1 n=1 Tax=Beutenbergia cavernae (strain ATCC BAA-8 / DSM 12333 / CCUG 43141 / JCM 11478 / NBRC 16432 / NCIMB 13614 / HKI 0122) TaxID=471853 RepID=C5BVK3_BEUC1|nr:extracellular solute-binding protein [Beutenbergia cavernae]ACQ78443.1 extracellular solute-binding protein family 1 [Beutenbergia cavernae DSM 12333]
MTRLTTTASPAFRRPGGAVSRRAMLGLLGAGAAGLTAACSASIGGGIAPDPAAFFSGDYDGDPVRLDFWNPFTGGDGPAMGAIVDAFNAAHPQIDVRMSSINADQMYAKLLPAVGAGQGPDVVAMHLDQLATFAIRGTIVSLDDIVEGLELDGADFVAQAWEATVFQDRRFGIPLDFFTAAQYWNVEAFDAAGVRAPWDGSSYLDVMAGLQASGVANPFWVSPAWQTFVGLLGQFGGSLFDADGTTATMGSDAGVEALTWICDVVADGFSPAGVTDVRPPFKNGSCVTMTDLPAAIPDLTLTAPDLEWGVGPFPQVGPQPGTFANSHTFTITQQTQADDDVAQAAQVFVHWVSQNSGQWAAGGLTPASTSVRESAEFAATPQSVLATEEVFASAVFLPQIPSSRDIAANSYQRAVSEAVLGQATPADALAFAQRTAQSQLDDVRRLFES